MDFNCIREQLINNTAIYERVTNHVFLFDKPADIESPLYILYSSKELNGGENVRRYQLDVRIVGKDKLDVLDLKDLVIEALDNFNRPTKIKDNTVTIRHTKLVNGGGMAFNEESGEYYSFLYFQINI